MAEVWTGELRAPWAQICGDATQAMLFHRRGAASIEMGSTPPQGVCPDFCHGLPARISHRLPAATADTLADTALRSVGRLDVLSSTPAAASVARLVSATSRPFRDGNGEKRGLQTGVVAIHGNSSDPALGVVSIDPVEAMRAE